MRNNLILTIALASAMILSVPFIASAEKNSKQPYGDFCNRVSHYGMNKHMLGIKDVKKSLNHYFGKKGLNFEIVKDKGRFIKALIKDKSKLIDTIIFDRHTGRIRSVY